MRTTLTLTFAATLMATNVFAADAIEPTDIVEFDQGRFEWTGFYVGGSLGYVYVEDDDPAFPVAPAVTIPLHSEGENSTLGVFAGFMYEHNDIIYGAEYEYVDLDTQFVGDGIGPLPIFVEDAHILRARFGYGITDNLQIYGFGGAMRSSINIGLDDWSPVVGAGIDFAMTENIIVGGQYNYSWFDDYDTTLIDGEIDYFSFRLSWKF